MSNGDTPRFVMPDALADCSVEAAQGPDGFMPQNWRPSYAREGGNLEPSMVRFGDLIGPEWAGVRQYVADLRGRADAADALARGYAETDPMLTGVALVVAGSAASEANIYRSEFIGRCTAPANTVLHWSHQTGMVASFAARHGTADPCDVIRYRMLGVTQDLMSAYDMVHGPDSVGWFSANEAQKTHGRLVAMLDPNYHDRLRRLWVTNGGKSDDFDGLVPAFNVAVTEAISVFGAVPRPDKPVLQGVEPGDALLKRWWVDADWEHAAAVAQQQLLVLQKELGRFAAGHSSGTIHSPPLMGMDVYSVESHAAVVESAMAWLREEAVPACVDLPDGFRWPEAAVQDGMRTLGAYQPGRHQLMFAPYDGDQVAWEDKANLLYPVALHEFLHALQYHGGRFPRIAARLGVESVPTFSTLPAVWLLQRYPACARELLRGQVTQRLSVVLGRKLHLGEITLDDAADAFRGGARVVPSKAMQLAQALLDPTHALMYWVAYELSAAKVENPFREAIFEMMRRSTREYDACMPLGLADEITTPGKALTLPTHPVLVDVTKAAHQYL